MDVFDDGGFDTTPLIDYTHDDNIILGGNTETSFITLSGGAERPIDSLYDNSTRDGSTFDATADVYSTDGTSVGTLPILPESPPPSDLETTSGTFGMKSPPPISPPRKQPW